MACKFIIVFLYCLLYFTFRFLYQVGCQTKWRNASLSLYFATTCDYHLRSSPTIPINIQYHLLYLSTYHTLSIIFSFTLYTKLFAAYFLMISNIQDNRIWCGKSQISNSVHLYKGKFATPAVERRYQEDFTRTNTTNTNSCQQHCTS